MRTVVEAAKEGRGLTAEEMREEERLSLAATLKWIDLVEITAEVADSILPRPGGWWSGESVGGSAPLFEPPFNM